MNIPAIKRYLGRGVKVKRLTKTTLRHALRHQDYRGVAILVPKQKKIAYIAFVGPTTGRIIAIYASVALVTPKMLDTLMEDIEREEEEEL